MCCAQQQGQELTCPLGWGFPAPWNLGDTSLSSSSSQSWQGDFYLLKVSSTTAFFLETGREGTGRAVPSHGSPPCVALAPVTASPAPQDQKVLPKQTAPAGAALSPRSLQARALVPTLRAVTSATLQNTKKQPRLLLPEEKDRNETQMLRRQRAFSKTEATPHGLPGRSWVGQQSGAASRPCRRRSPRAVPAAHPRSVPPCPRCPRCRGAAPLRPPAALGALKREWEAGGSQPAGNDF